MPVVGGVMALSPKAKIRSALDKIEEALRMLQVTRDTMLSALEGLPNQRQRRQRKRRRTAH